MLAVASTGQIGGLQADDEEGGGAGGGGSRGGGIPPRWTSSGSHGQKKNKKARKRSGREEETTTRRKESEDDDDEEEDDDDDGREDEDLKSLKELWATKSSMIVQHSFPPTRRGRLMAEMIRDPDVIPIFVKAATAMLASSFVRVHRQGNIDRDQMKMIM